MQPKNTPKKKQHDAPRGTKFTVKKLGDPMISIIHLDCGAGGDCTVIFTESEFVVIDGGKVETGKRLSNLLAALMEKGITPLAFIVSHFDTDHYLGLFHAVKTLCTDFYGNDEYDDEEDEEDEEEDEDDEEEDEFPEINIITPASEEVLNKDLYGKPANLEEASSVAVACRQLKNAIEAIRKVKITFNDAESLAFENGFVLELQNSPSPLSPSICNGNNASSLQWILKDSEERTATTYYTGGDAEGGPLDATIVKLDHHGSTVGTTNSAASKLKKTLYWIIMGAGRVHKHPGQGLITHANTRSNNIVMTQHHFTDEYDGHKLVYVSRTPPHWGDTGISLYPKERILVNVDNTRSLVTIGTEHFAINNDTSIKLDAELSELLDVTRLIGNCPNEKRCDRGSFQEPPPLQCLHAGCDKEATEMSLNTESTTFVACEAHGIAELERQQSEYTLKRTAEKQAELKRERKLQEQEDEDGDYEAEDDDEYEEDQSDDEEVEKIYKKRKRS